ncbi:VacB/RNase II family 3'-5' exoribonuclease [Tychonema sp. LEGE 07199]|uniref:ribonuclease R family protein n=1 Tax=unclassified Tychonema TaxID=2642144 RepID=UPI00187F5FD4|nr:MULTISPECIES: ribonuclease R family protein [unclassified Tychonema]MBE9119604.1 VacB/RNase II family 3'-5' exoribonuclease [Tychonema sp. LEGE 07199]MBE9131808.1 VacB/RNase II family 3'-5' exoribonuclease [Tychonema sp. LEGE 07196]
MEFSIAALLANFTEDKLVAPKALEKKLDCNDATSQLKLQIALEALEKIGILVKDKGRYRRVAEDDVVEAKLRCSSKGFCFAIQDAEGSEDVYVRESHLSTAWNGDRVLVKIIKEGSRRRSPEGEVMLILERANPSVLARVKQTATPTGRVSYRAIPLDDRLLFELDLLANGTNLQEAIDHLVHVEVKRYPLGTHRPVGKVVQVLGSDAEAADDLDIVCCKHDLPRSFPAAVIKAAENLPSKLKKTDIKKRLDLRNSLTVTFSKNEEGETNTQNETPQVPEENFSEGTAENEIENEFDPTSFLCDPPIERALSIETLKSGGWQVAIHIADAAEYVQPETPLDREARKRGTSAHLGEKIIPVQPQILNDRCSLQPDTERLAFSILLTLDESGELTEYEIQTSVIHIDYQLSYEQAQAIIEPDSDAEDNPLSSALRPFLDQIRAASQAARQARLQRGAFELNLPDANSHFDDEGELGAFTTATPAQSAVSELVVLANQAVATHLQALGVPAIYRVQPMPDPADIQEFIKLSNNLGGELYLENEEEVLPLDFQRFTQQFADLKSERVLTYLLEDTMKPAVYSTTPKPHFGLALQDGYTRCTSPLSRYADLLVLRVLQAVFEQGRSSRTTRAKEKVNLHHSSCHGQITWNVLPPDLHHEFETEFAAAVVHLTERERVAEDAESDLQGLKKTGLMKERTGQTFQGLITGVQSYGFFVEIEVRPPESELLRVEGLVHVSSLKDDWYEYRSRQQTLVGRKNRNQYRLGDRVEVQVKSVDYYRQQIDLVAVGGGSQAFDDEE